MVLRRTWSGECHAAGGWEETAEQKGIWEATAGAFHGAFASLVPTKGDREDEEEEEDVVASSSRGCCGWGVERCRTAGGGGRCLRGCVGYGSFSSPIMCGGGEGGRAWVGKRNGEERW